MSTGADLKPIDIYDIIDILRTHKRSGDGMDEPEGSKYIQISDTLANMMADVLKNDLRGVMAK